MCQWTGITLNDYCASCYYRLPRNYDQAPMRNCPGPLCRHLGDPIQRDGVAILVKCNCPKTNGYTEQWHQATHCHAPRNATHRCLPSMRTPFDNDHATEAALYRLCYSCELRE